MATTMFSKDRNSYNFYRYRNTIQCHQHILVLKKETYALKTLALGPKVNTVSKTYFEVPDLF